MDPRVKPAVDTCGIHAESGKPENALVARVEAREALPRQDAPAPLPRRNVPTNVAVAVFPLLNDAKSVTEKVKVGRAARKARVDDVDGIGLDIVLQTRSRVLTGAAAQHQKCHKDCCCAAHPSALPAWSRVHVCFSADPCAGAAGRGLAHEVVPAGVYSIGGRPAALAPTKKPARPLI